MQGLNVLLVGDARPIDLFVGTAQPLNVLFVASPRPVSQPPNAFVMQGLDLLGGRPRPAAQELET